MLARLRDTTGESAQLYRRQGDARVCVAAAERGSGLRDTVPVGTALPMTAGSRRAGAAGLERRDDPLVAGAAFAPGCWPRCAGAGGRTRSPSASRASRRCRRRCGGATAAVVAAVSVSGPLERLTRSPGRLHAQAVVAAAAELSREAG